jgi:hypothetical protein
MLIKKYDVFVETGTLTGEGANYLAGLCKRGYTIDVIDRYKDRKSNVTFLLGDSSKELKTICESVEENCVFWLDAHYPDDTSLGMNLPLIKELEIIASTREGKNDLILIDDLRIYETANFGSGNLPVGYEKGEVGLIDVIQSLFPGKKVETDLSHEGYVIIS